MLNRNDGVFVPRPVAGTPTSNSLSTHLQRKSQLLTRETLTLNHLRTVYEYNRGEFYRKTKTHLNAENSIVKSHFDKEGYEMIGILGVKGGFRKHRVVWFYFHGRWPYGQIDHIDRNKSNNNIENLREVTDGDNKMNMPMYKNNKTGVCGVHLIKTTGYWRAKITVNKEIYILGHFKDFDEAVVVRKEAERRFGFSPTHGLKPEQLPPEVAVSA